MLHFFAHHWSDVIATLIVAVAATMIYADVMSYPSNRRRPLQVFFAILMPSLFVGAAIWGLA